MGVLDIIVRLLDQFEIIALPVGMLLGMTAFQVIMDLYRINGMRIH